MTYTRYDKLQVLVIDDFRQFLVTMKTMLEDFGIKHVDVAANANDALLLCANRHYDVILSDYNLGQNKKNGQQILESLRQDSCASKNSLFILITAETGKSMVMATYDYEPDGYLSKPFNSKLLRQRLERVLSRRDALKPVVTALNENQLDVAKQLCEAAISEGGRYASECRQMLGNLYLQMGDYPSAETLFRASLDGRVTPWATLGLAKVCNATERNSEAIEHLTGLIESHPQYMQTYDVLAQILKEEGESRRSQEVLAKAVEMSPLSILRQKELAQSAEENKDMRTAANAYFSCVQLGTHSRHDTLDTHLSFGRTAAALLVSNPEEGKKFSTLAVKTLENAAKRFDSTREVDAKILLLRSQVYAGLGEQTEADDLLKRAEKLLDILQDQVDVETRLDWLNTLTANNQSAKAQAVLDAMTSDSSNESELEKFDYLLPEPSSKKNRKLIAAINHRGIDLYNQKQYEAAIHCFSDALVRFPKHIGIHLNLMQSIVSNLREKGLDPTQIVLMERSLTLVNSSLSTEHSQHKRYINLREKYFALKQAKGA